MYTQTHTCTHTCTCTVCVNIKFPHSTFVPVAVCFYYSPSSVLYCFGCAHIAWYGAVLCGAVRCGAVQCACTNIQ